MNRITIAKNATSGFRSLLAIAAMLATVEFSTRAATIDWSSTAATTAWATGTNWSGGTAPADSVSTDHAQFNQTSYANNPNYGTRSINQLIFGDGVTATAPITLSGTSLSVGGAITMNANAGDVTINGTNQIGWASLTMTNNSANLLSIPAGLKSRGTGGTSTFTFTGTGATTIGGAVSNGSGSNVVVIQKNGAGTLTFGGANTYTGATNVNVGTLKFLSTAASTAYAVASSAVLEFDSSAATITNTASATFTGTGTLRKSGANSLVWSSGAANFQLGSGALIDVQGGTLTGGSTANEVWTSNLADLNVAGGATFAGVEANVKVDAITGTGTISTGFTGAGYTTFTIGVDNGSSTFDGVIANGSAAGNVTKAGTGTITLTNANTFSGGTIISGGTIVAANTAALGSAGRTVRLNTGGVLDLATNTSANAWVIDMGSSNTGTILVNRATSGAGITHVMGVSTLGNATLNVQAGVLVSGGSPTLQMGGINLTAGASGTLLLNPTTADLVVTGAVNIGLNSFAKTLGLAGTSAGNEISGVISNNLNTLSVTKTGTSTWDLSGANTYTGATTVSGGTLTLSGARSGSSGVITVSNVAATDATLNISNGTHALGGNEFGVGQAVTTAATGTVNQSGGSVTFSSGNQMLIARGSGTLANTGVYNLSAGSITTSASTSRGIMLGVNSTTIGRFNLSGTGVLNMTAASGGGGDAALMIGRYDSSVNNTQATFSQTGGTANVGILSIGGDGATGTGLSGTFTVTGGTFTASQFPRLAAGNTNTAEINIGGTADVTLPAFPTVRGTTSTATIYFDGGTLRPLAASSAYMGGLTAAYVKAGGVKFDVASGKDITVSQDLLTHGVSTGGGLTKAGVGVLALGGNSTYTGATSVTGGTLNVQHNNALGTTAGATSLTTGTKLQVQGVGLNIPENFTLGTGSTGVTVENVSGTNILSGTITRNGALTFTSLSGHLTVQSGIGNTNNSVNMGGAGDGEISGPITVAFSVNKNDAGTWTLSGNNTYTTATTVNLGGALRITHNNALGTTAGGTSVNNLGALQLAGGITVTGESLSLNGPGVANDGGLRNISGNNTWAGNVAVGAASVTRVVSDADLLTITGTVGLSAPASNQFVLQGDGNILLSGVISGVSGVTSSVTGTGVRTLGNANTYSGTTTVSGGTLRLLNNASVGSGTLRLNGGRLTSDANPRTITNSVEVPLDSALGSGTAGFDGSILLSGNVVMQGADSSRVLTVDSPVTMAGTVTGSSLRGLIKGGSSTLTLSGSGDWNGNTGVTAGTFQMTGNSSIPSGGNLSASGTGVFRMNTTGVLNASSTSILDSSEIRLEAGTLRTNSITLGGSGTFNWSGGTLETHSNAVLGSGVDASQSGGAAVYTGRTLSVTGNLTTGAGTNLDLGDLYLSGSVLYNQITITGSLSVGAGTTLSALDSPYLLRPSTGGMNLDWGTLVLVDATGGITNPSNFAFVAPLADGRPFSEFTGTWVSAGDPAQLDPDTWYLEYTANQVLFHYKVSAAIPEPASAGLVLAGGLLLRTLSRRSRAR